MARLSHTGVPGYRRHVPQRGVRSMNVFHSEGNRCEYIGMLGRQSSDIV